MIPKRTSMPAIADEGVPPIVAALPTATSNKHIAEKTAAYVTANKTALSARRFVALSTAMTMIIVSGLTILARANGSTVSSRWSRSVAMVGPLLGQVFPQVAEN
jgi:hypothetical protein